VTAYVDRELPPQLEHAVERHLSACTACAAQAAFEIGLQATLSAVPAPRLRPGFPASVLHKAFAEQPFAALSR
jgi:anti-sigma factor RsiW